LASNVCRTFGIRKKDYRIEKLEYPSEESSWYTLQRTSIRKDRIDHSELTYGAIIGSAILYDVKQYKKKTELEIDRTKPLADIKKFGFCRYGFMIKNSHRLRIICHYNNKT
jgi:hypothetical protein